MVKIQIRKILRLSLLIFFCSIFERCSSNKIVFHQFIDPSEWNAANIKTWLNWSTKKFDIKPPPVRSRIPNTGKELVELSKAEFWVCAGSKHGGNTLAKYIAWKVYDATGKWIPSLQNKNDPGKRKQSPK